MQVSRPVPEVELTHDTLNTRGADAARGTAAATRYRAPQSPPNRSDSRGETSAPRRCTARDCGRAVSAWVPAPRHGPHVCIAVADLGVCRVTYFASLASPSPFSRGRTTKAFRVKSRRPDAASCATEASPNGTLNDCSRGEMCPSVGLTCTGGTTCGPRARPRCTWGTRSG